MIFSLFIISFWLTTGCGGTDDPPNGPDTPQYSSFINIDPSITHQTISGFGGADGIFNGPSVPNNTEIQTVFGTGDNELGLSIFRIKVPYNPNDWQGLVSQSLEAKKYGAKIIASPWSPPLELKSNYDPVEQQGDVVGGILPPKNYEAFANHLNEFISFMESNGVEIYAISVQNEPDITVGYESCDWSSVAMRDFIKEFGGTITTSLMAPESFNFNQGYTNAILNDPDAVANLDIVAGHIYGGGLAPYPLAEQKEKEIWMTEYLLNLSTGNQGATPWSDRSDEDKWNETMQMLEGIHDAMTYNWNAYVWWYLKRYYSFIGEGQQGTTQGEILKRGYAFSHYSKFVRPDYVRVESEVDVTRDLLVTSYSGDDKTIVVVVNPGQTSVSDIVLTVSGEAPESATVYRTSLNLDRERQDLTVEEDGNLIFTVTPRSVITVIIE